MSKNQSPKPLKNSARLPGGDVHRSHLPRVSMELIMISNPYMHIIVLKRKFKSPHILDGPLILFNVQNLMFWGII